MKKGVLLFCIVMMITGWYSCTKDTASKSSTAGAASCDSTKVSFTRDIQPVFVASCAVAGCHDGTTKQNGYDFSQYIDTKTAGQSGQLVCTLQGASSSCGGIRMPEGADPLPDSVITKVKNWTTGGYCN
jgi:hypothetical protein